MSQDEAAFFHFLESQKWISVLGFDTDVEHLQLLYIVGNVVLISKLSPTEPDVIVYLYLKTKNYSVNDALSSVIKTNIIEHKVLFFCNMIKLTQSSSDMSSSSLSSDSLSGMTVSSRAVRL